MCRGASHYEADSCSARGDDEVRVIIVCDQPSAARRLCGELSNCPAEIICVANLVELRAACESVFELALINVAWAELVECLRTIRESPSGANCSVLDRFSVECPAKR